MKKIWTITDEQMKKIVYAMAGAKGFLAAVEHISNDRVLREGAAKAVDELNDAQRTLIWDSEMKFVEANCESQAEEPASAVGSTEQAK